MPPKEALLARQSAMWKRTVLNIPTTTVRGCGLVDNIVGVVACVRTLIGTVRTGEGVQITILTPPTRCDNGLITSILSSKTTVSVGSLKITWTPRLLGT